ncbi:MAG: transcription antitermination factor NusB [Lachnospiraceae bacterium]|jgi:N utilization substance protein B|nr:transcription antitermination factor NusB [Lachnospiraceae bacterium]SDA38262.1 NusB antitermination factor [Lachnospiraceae bacterium G11]
MTRHELREQVFKLLFRVEFNVPEDMDEQVKLFMEDIDNHASEKENEEINKKYVAVKEHLSEIDAMINDKAENWSVERMGKVELTILRLAIFEMKFDDDVPVNVAINEAVELAKKFGQDNSGAFVNGILAKFA